MWVGWYVDKLLLRLHICVRLVCGVGCTPTRSFLLPIYATTYVNCVGSPHIFFFEKGLTLQLSPYVSETPNGIVYAMMLSTTLKLYLLWHTPLANFPLLGGQRFVFGRDGLWGGAFLSSLVDTRVVTSKPSLKHKSSINPPIEFIGIKSPTNYSRLVSYYWVGLDRLGSTVPVLDLDLATSY